MSKVSREEIEIKANELRTVIKRLIELEKLFNSQVTSRTSLDDLLNSDSDEAKEYKELRKKYIELYDFIGKHDMNLLKKIIKEYEENAEHLRFMHTIKREKIKKQDETVKVKRFLEEYKRDIDDLIMDLAKTGGIEKIHNFYILEKLYKRNEELDKKREKYKETLKKLKDIESNQYEDYIKQTKHWFEIRMYKYNIEAEKFEDQRAYEEKKAKIEAGQENEKTSFGDLLCDFFFGTLENEKNKEEQDKNKQADIKIEVKKKE